MTEGHDHHPWVGCTHLSVSRLACGHLKHDHHCETAWSKKKRITEETVPPVPEVHLLRLTPMPTIPNDPTPQPPTPQPPTPNTHTHTTSSLVIQIQKFNLGHCVGCTHLSVSRLVCGHLKHDHHCETAWSKKNASLKRQCLQCLRSTFCASPQCPPTPNHPTPQPPTPQPPTLNTHTHTTSSPVIQIQKFNLGHCVGCTHLSVSRLVCGHLKHDHHCETAWSKKTASLKRQCLQCLRSTFCASPNAPPTPQPPNPQPLNPPTPNTHTHNFVAGDPNSKIQSGTLGGTRRPIPCS